MKANENQIFALRQSFDQNARLAAKNRFLKLTAAALVSSILTLSAVMVLDNQLRGALISSAFNQAQNTDFPILIFDTQTGTYTRCRSTSENLACQQTQ